MAFLFTIDSNNVVLPNTETLLITPFKEIWSRDKSKKKETAIQEFSYIEFMSSMKKSNPFKQYPEDKKHDAIVESIIKIKNWKPDKFVLEGVKYIKKLQEEASLTYNYYMSAKKAAEKMQDFFENFDINERNIKTGAPIYKPSDISRALNDVEKNLTTFANLQKKVEEELFETTRTKSNKEISPFADPNSI